MDMKMTIEEYRYYSYMTKVLFEYMNGRINKLNNNCILDIQMYDPGYKRFGTIRYPCYIVIYVGDIVDSWQDEWGKVLNKNDYIGSCIAWAVAHELFHADQQISMLQYNANPIYKQQVENDVERSSYDWVKRHAKAIELRGKFKVKLGLISSPTLVPPRFCNYHQASVKEFYLQTIMNIIIRDSNLFYKFEAFTNDNYCESIILNFADEEKIIIKFGGEYLKDSIPYFSSLAFRYAGYYDRYGIRVSAELKELPDKTHISEIKFDFINRMIHPIETGPTYRDLEYPIEFY